MCGRGQRIVETLVVNRTLFVAQERTVEPVLQVAGPCAFSSEGIGPDLTSPISNARRLWSNFARKQVDWMTRFWLSDENNISTTVFTMGSTIFIQGRGLHPSTLYDFYLSGVSTEGATTLLARYSTDRYGILSTTPLIPYVGALRHDADARRGTVGRTFFIRAEARGKTGHGLENLDFAVMPAESSRWIFSCDANGRLQTGIEQRNGSISIALRNFAAGCVRVFLVPRQAGWRVGDPVVPVATRKGASCRRVFLHDGSSERIVKLAESYEIPAGTYQFIARSFPLGWDEAGEATLLADDVVSDRQFASLVIRLPFKKRLGLDDGVVLTPENAGHLPADRPDVRFVNISPNGSGVKPARGPDALPLRLSGRRPAIHVIRHETAAQWSVCNAL
jgi:hypothetical protein